MSHMTLNDRVIIQLRLEMGVTVSEIAKEIGKDPSTVSREIKKHRVLCDKGVYGRIKNRCIFRRDCKKEQLCSDRPDCTRRCASCGKCNSVCPNYKEETCGKLLCAPYVCNGCTEKTSCVLKKYEYEASSADKEYRELLSGVREGFNLTMKEVKKIDEIVSPLVRKGQSIHHIWVHHASEFEVSERTIDRLLKDGMLTARLIDLPRACKLKPRATEKKPMKVDKKCRQGRTYEDYLAFINQSNGLLVAQTDSVIGAIGGKVMLTIHFPKAELMLMFLRDANTADSVKRIFDFLFVSFGTENFHILFPAILTDNGTEFSDPHSIEFDENGLERTRIFYCNPHAAYQKPEIERNHELIRQILPHGSSFDTLTQADMRLLMSHINSYSRPSLGDRTPFEMFAYIYGEGLLNDLLRLLCLSVIDPDSVVLTPHLLTKK